MPGSADDPVKQDPFQQIIEVGWPPVDEDPTIPSRWGYGIISAWRDGGLWQFEAQMMTPGAERIGSDPGEFILGGYQTGLSGGTPGDYAYSNANRTDPPDGRTVVGGDPMILPTVGEMENLYLWHTGFAQAGQHSSLIVNMRKITEVFGTPGISVQIAGLGSATAWLLRIFESDALVGPGAFTFLDETKRVEFTQPLIAQSGGPLYPSIVTAVDIPFIF